jgi:hypothetical protein
VLTLLGGQIVHGADEHKDLAPALPAATPDWSPVRTFGGYQQKRADAAPMQKFAAACGCGSACNVHGHVHAASWAADAPTADPGGFWGVMGCSCWAV